MSGWLILLGYLGGALVAFYPIYRFFLEDEGPREADTMDQVMCGAMAFLVLMIWPIVVAGYWSWKVSRRIWEGKRTAVDLEKADR